MQQSISQRVLASSSLRDARYQHLAPALQGLGNRFRTVSPTKANGGNWKHFFGFLVSFTATKKQKKIHHADKERSAILD